MKFDPQKALVLYSGALTAVVIGVMVSAAVQGAGPARFTEIDVERINVKEADGTLRLTISNQERFPEIIVKGREYRHPGRDTAGMLFFNEEGTETGGLTWGGSETNGVRRSSGSLTFDRYEQDQTIQMMSSESGNDRVYGFRVNDQAEGSMDFDVVDRMAGLPQAERASLADQVNIDFTPRAFLGRQPSGASELVLRDGEGRARLRLSVALDGGAKIDFLNEAGQTTRTMTPDG